MNQRNNETKQKVETNKSSQVFVHICKGPGYHQVITKPSQVNFDTTSLKQNGLEKRVVKICILMSCLHYNEFLLTKKDMLSRSLRPAYTKT